LHAYDEYDQDPAQDYSGKRHTTATLTGLLDLVQRDKAEDQAEEGPNDTKPSEQRADQRRDGHPVRTGALRRASWLFCHAASWNGRDTLYPAPVALKGRWIA
jgi:hypothetical protein